MQPTSATAPGALSLAARIVEVARALGACDHEKCAATERNPERNLHCPLCGGAGFLIFERTDSMKRGLGVVGLRSMCNGGCDRWAIARALLPHLEAAALDPAPLWDGIQPPDKRLPFRTAYEFGQDTPPEPLMLVDGLIAHGTLTEFLAAPKAGKTTLIMSLIAAVLEGRDFLGHKTRRVPVFYFTEENPATFREALRRAGLLDTRDLHVISKHETGGKSLAELIPAAMEFAQRFAEPGLIVVDTFPKFAGFEDDEENASGAARAALEPLEAAAAAGFAVLYTRHDRKGGGSLVEAGRGSSTFAATADVLLGLRRAEGRGQANRRTLSGIGRIDGLPDQLVIEYAEGIYTVVGEGASAVRDETAARVLAALPPADAEPLTVTMLMKQTPGVSRATITRSLDDLVAGGSVEQVGGLGANRRTRGYRHASLSIDP